jgi:serine/threonine protein kinase
LKLKVSADKKKLKRENLDRDQDLVGSEDYASPEMLSDQEHGTSVDLWALGVIAFVLFSGKTPFKGRSQEETFDNIKSGTIVNKEVLESLPSVTRDLIEKLLVLNPDNRLGASCFDDLIAHPFFEGIDFVMLPEIESPLNKSLSSMSLIDFSFSDCNKSRFSSDCSVNTYDSNGSTDKVLEFKLDGLMKPTL